MARRIRRRWKSAVAAGAALTILLAAGVVWDGRIRAGNADPRSQSMVDSAGTLPPGAALPSEQQCAAVARQVGSDQEVRPENRAANMSVPSDVALPAWPDFWEHPADGAFRTRITGNFTGTTDQIIAWGACKWGVSTDVVRAWAWAESSWRQSNVDDFTDVPSECVGGAHVPCPTSFGLVQLKHLYRPGSWPNSQRHTAFNLDYGLAYLRGCYEGWVTYLREDGYEAGDLPGCLGWHYSGEWRDGDSLAYIGRVQKRFDEAPWTQQ